MNRRGLLGMLGIGATVGPAVAKQMIYQEASAPYPISTSGIGSGILGPKEIPWSPLEELKCVKQDYETFTADPSKWITDYISRDWHDYRSGYSNYTLDKIDPDIRNMKSLSESTKMRMFFERRAKRAYEDSKNSIWNRMQQLIKET